MDFVACYVHGCTSVISSMEECEYEGRPGTWWLLYLDVCVRCLEDEAYGYSGGISHLLKK